MGQISSIFCSSSKNNNNTNLGTNNNINNTRNLEKAGKKDYQRKSTVNNNMSISTKNIVSSNNSKRLDDEKENLLNNHENNASQDVNTNTDNSDATKSNSLTQKKRAITSYNTDTSTRKKNVKISSDKDNNIEKKDEYYCEEVEEAKREDDGDTDEKRTVHVYNHSETDTSTIDSLENNNNNNSIMHTAAADTEIITTTTASLSSGTSYHQAGTELTTIINENENGDYSSAEELDSVIIPENNISSDSTDIDNSSANGGSNPVNTSYEDASTSIFTTSTSNNYIDLSQLQNGQEHAPGYQTLLIPKEKSKFSNKKCLVLDLDETLVHSSFKYVNNADFVLPVTIDNQTHHVYVIKRPGVDEFLEKAGKLFEVVVFTASVSRYGDPLLDILDKSKSIHHRLFRESCYSYEGNYVKNLSQIGRPLSDIIILDNSPASYIFHPQHAIPISSWFSDIHDNELLDMLPLLEDISRDSVLNVANILDVTI